MTIGPEPISRMLSMSVLFGMILLCTAAAPPFVMECSVASCPGDQPINGGPCVGAIGGSGAGGAGPGGCDGLYNCSASGIQFSICLMRVTSDGCGDRNSGIAPCERKHNFPIKFFGHPLMRSQKGTASRGSYPACAIKRRPM